MWSRMCAAHQDITSPEWRGESIQEAVTDSGFWKSGAWLGQCDTDELEQERGNYMGKRI